jgi:c(7)-type cytochrome triheme protein
MAIFDVSRAAQITRRDHNQEVYCFTCHNGEMAFAARRNCANCHLEEPEGD